MSKEELKKQLKKIACDAIENNKDDLNEISQDLWKNPELSFEEEKAHNTLTSYLEKKRIRSCKKFSFKDFVCCKVWQARWNQSWCLLRV